jgi:hypothetical protein
MVGRCGASGKTRTNYAQGAQAFFARLRAGIAGSSDWRTRRFSIYAERCAVLIVIINIDISNPEFIEARS